MEYDQLVKRYEFLDEERRKEKLLIAALEERLAALEGSASALTEKNKELDSEVTRLTTISSRFNEVDEAIGNAKIDLGRKIEALEKKVSQSKREQSNLRSEVDALNQFMAEGNAGLETIADLKKTVQARVDEDLRLAHMLDELESKFEEVLHASDESRRVQRSMEEGRRQDTKRLTDIHSELTALRKRLDEQRGKVDLNSDGIRKLEMRLSELHSAETERRQTLNSFIEKQNMIQLDRDRIWKEWQARFEKLSKQASEFEAQLIELDATHRAVKQAQEALEEVTQRFDRRVNELTEMQRLGEERFRNEWVTFKADDQKRWTNYTLAQEEQQRERMRLLDKHNDRLILLEDMTQDLRDSLQQIIESTQKRNQILLTMLNEAMDEYERLYGRAH